MTEKITCAGNPDAEIIEKLTDAIMTVCERQRELDKRHKAMCEELAALLCPFAEGERIRIPRPSHADGHAEGYIRGVWFHSDYGYHLFLGYDDDSLGTLSGYMNAELELCNGKSPILPPKVMDECLRLLRDAQKFF